LYTAIGEAALEAKQILPDALEASFVLDLKFLNVVPQFPVGIVIRGNLRGDVR